MFAGDVLHADGGVDGLYGGFAVAELEEFLAEAQPFRPRSDDSDGAEPPVAQRGIAQGEILGVVVGEDEHMGPGRELIEHDLRGGWVMQRDVRGAGGDHLDRLRAEDVRARVGEMEVRVVAGEDPGDLLTHVAKPEHSDDRGRGHVFEEHLHHAPAALGAVVVARVFVEAELERLHVRVIAVGAFVLGEHLAGGIDDGGFHVAPADRAVRRLRTHRHLRPDVPRGMAAYGDDRGEYGACARGGEVRQSREPTFGRHVCSSASAGSAAEVRTRCTDQNTASGVAGEARVTEVPGRPNAPAASRRASRAAKASMRGGSPTAFDPYTLPGSVACEYVATRKSCGISEKEGILYVLGPGVVRRPRPGRSAVSHTSSSSVSHPAPWM